MVQLNSWVKKTESLVEIIMIGKELWSGTINNGSRLENGICRDNPSIISDHFLGRISDRLGKAVLVAIH